MYGDYLEFAKSVARGAGKIIRKYFKSEVSESIKGFGDIVTEADARSEEYIIQRIRKRYRDHSILAEESGGIEGSEYRWIVDPLDGTTNFKHHIPYLNISIALKHTDNTIVGVVYNPILDEMFYATVNTPAMMNDKEIKPSDQSDPSRMFIGICHGSSRESIQRFLDNTSKYKFHVREIRRLGSAGLEICYVASGMLSAFIGIDLKPWDYEAALLIAKRAGCYIETEGNTIKVYASENVKRVLDRI